MAEMTVREVRDTLLGVMRQAAEQLAPDSIVVVGDSPPDHAIAFTLLPGEGERKFVVSDGNKTWHIHITEGDLDGIVS